MSAAVSIKKIRRSCQEVSTILKALSHPQRLLILGHLLMKERTVSELVDVCDISQSQMSQFLIRMRTEGLIACRRDGRHQYYFVDDKRLMQLMRTIQEQYCEV